MCRRDRVKAIAIEQGLEFFDARANTGFRRQLMLRITTMGELLLVLCVYENDQKKRQGILDEIIRRIPSLTSVYYCINTKMNDFMYDLDMELYHGKRYDDDRLGEIVFQIGPHSYFQTTKRYAKGLYNVIVDFAGFMVT